MAHGEENSVATWPERLVAWFTARPTRVVVLWLIPVAVYVCLVLRFAVNIPLADDYDSILAFLIRVAESDAFPWDDLLVQHNEHRIAWTRGIALAAYRLLGELDFRVLIYLGNLPLLIVTAIVACDYRRHGWIPLAFAPIPFLLLQPQSWENMTWAMASLQNFYVILFATLTMIAWSHGTRVAQAIALLLATVATYTSGNGFVLWPVLLIWETTRARRNLRTTVLRLGLLSGLLLLISWFYFRGYVPPPHHPSMLDELKHPVRLLTFAAAMQGSFLGELGPAAAVVAGILQFVGIGYLAATRYDRTNPTVFYLLLFCVGTVFLAALGRAGFGIGQALSYRYRVVSVLAIALYYWASLELFPRVLTRASVLCGITLSAMTLFGLMTGKAAIRLEQRRAMLVNGVATWHATGEGLAYPDPERALQIIRLSNQHGTYRFPAN